MSILLHGDCLEHMKSLDDNSVDFIFCDLPYGQTSCKWDIIVPWQPFWEEIMRIKKLNTPVFFTTTTKFGVQLINSAPKKMPFRWDLVWVKSAPAGFLSAKKMPMRKHEMIYAFYEKLPFYDLSSHKHKFIKTKPREKEDLYGMKGHADGKEGKYDPPLPVSVVKEEPKTINTLYQNDIEVPDYVNKRNKKTGMSAYDPPLPVSVVKDQQPNSIYGEGLPKTDKGTDAHSAQYDPQLPNSILEVKSTRGKHSTEKPVALMEWLLKYFSKEGDVVLDPTMGSGSTGVACKNMNRNFIGIEMDDEIYEVAVNRIEN